MKRLILCVTIILIVGTSWMLAAPNPKSSTSGSRSANSNDPKQIHFETGLADGEQRYRANCSRCHQAPPKFAPAAMGTLIRHMRVRAMITDEDMRAILKFMSQ